MLRISIYSTTGCAAATAKTRLLLLCLFRWTMMAATVASGDPLSVHASPATVSPAAISNPACLANETRCALPSIDLLEGVIVASPNPSLNACCSSRGLLGQEVRLLVALDRSSVLFCVSRVVAGTSGLSRSILLPTVCSTMVFTVSNLVTCLQDDTCTAASPSKKRQRVRKTPAAGHVSEVAAVDPEISQRRRRRQEKLGGCMAVSRHHSAAATSSHLSLRAQQQQPHHLLSMRQPSARPAPHSVVLQVIPDPVLVPVPDVVLHPPRANIG